MENLFIWGFAILMGIAVSGALLGLLDILILGGKISKSLSERYDLKKFLPVDDTYSSPSPFLVLMVIPYIFLFKLGCYPYQWINRTTRWYSNPEEDKTNINIQKRIFK
ncbi:MAG: hypothetical protein PHW04_13505 [Candidatus Wallbacteria bacterium]|nr:hypothetical protein [Candidatus Wallbacteria bacterium]